MVAREMDIPEQFFGIRFTFRENDDRTCSWRIHPPAGLPSPSRGSTGTVNGGQNEAILAARKAINVYLDEKARRPREKEQVR
jgi:hypothetical protein